MSKRILTFSAISLLALAAVFGSLKFAHSVEKESGQVLSNASSVEAPDINTSSEASAAVAAPAVASHEAGNARVAADFNRLPAEQQQEIKALSGRDGDAGKSYQTIEVKPGVIAVVANNAPKVVPVAVMNEDGTVSIHEY